MHMRPMAELRGSPLINKLIVSSTRFLYFTYRIARPIQFFTFCCSARTSLSNDEKDCARKFETFQTDQNQIMRFYLSGRCLRSWKENLMLASVIGAICTRSFAQCKLQYLSYQSIESLKNDGATGKLSTKFQS